MDPILDEPQADELRLKERLNWWERKRILFNVIVGLSGSPVLFIAPLNVFILIAVLIWGLGANFLYNTGFLLESLDGYYFKGKLKLDQYRMLFFILGTGAYVVISIIIAAGMYHSFNEQF